MTTVIVALSIAYAGIAALLLNLNLATQYGAVVKTLAIVTITGFYVMAWQGHQNLLGWATPADFPEEFRLHWITIDEPNKSTGEAGTIYFWLRRLDEAGLAVGEPRAHRLVWDEKIAEAAERALSTLEGGELLNGRISRQMMVPIEEAVQSIPNDASPAVSGSDGFRPQFEFARVPPPALPAKPLPDNR